MVRDLSLLHIKPIDFNDFGVILFPKHREAIWGSDLSMIVNPASCLKSSGKSPQRFSMFLASMAFSLRFCSESRQGDRFYSSLAHTFLQSTVFVERNGRRNRDPQKSAVL